MTQPTIETGRIFVKPRFLLAARKVLAVSTWGEDTVQRAATEIRRRRTQLGLSAQALSDRTAELGHTVSRTTISDLELGRRGERLLVPDLIVLAAALYTSPGELLYPYMPHGPVEVLPGVTGTSISAASWLGIGSEIYGLGGEPPVVWDGDSADRNLGLYKHVMLVCVELDRVLREVEKYRDLMLTESSKQKVPAFDVFLAAYERHRERALWLVGQLRQFKTTLDEDRLAHLGVIEAGDDG